MRNSPVKSQNKEKVSFMRNYWFVLYIFLKSTTEKNVVVNDPKSQNKNNINLRNTNSRKLTITRIS